MFINESTETITEKTPGTINGYMTKADIPADAGADQLWLERFQRIKARFPLLRPKLYLPYAE